MESEEKNIYEKKNHHCSGSHRRYFGSSCDYFNFGTDADADLTSGRQSWIWMCKHGRGCPKKIGGSGAGRYNDKDYFMRQTDQEGYVDMMPE